MKNYIRVTIPLLIFAVWASLLFGADVKISGLPSVTVPAGSDLHMVSQVSGTAYTSRAESLDQITSYVTGSSALTTLLAGKQNSLGYTAENTANKATSTSLGTSDTLYPSQNAVKQYVDARVLSLPTDTTKTYFSMFSGGSTTWATSFSYDATTNSDVWSFVTQTAGDNSNKAATTHYVDAAVTAAGGGNLSSYGTPTVHQFSVFNDATHIKGVSVTGSKVVCSDSSGEPIACTNLTDVAPVSAPTGTGLVVDNNSTLALVSYGTGSQFAVMNSGGTAVTFRSMVAADVPTLNQNTTGTAANVSGTPALPNGTTATTQSAGDNSTKLATTAYVDTISIPTVTSGNGLTISTPNTYLISTGTGTNTLPTTAAGKQACFRQANAGTNAIAIAPPASSYVEAADGSAYCTVSHGIKSAGANGDSICYVAIDTTHWMMFGGAKGTWTCQ